MSLYLRESTLGGSARAVPPDPCLRLPARRAAAMTRSDHLFDFEAPSLSDQEAVWELARTTDSSGVYLLWCNDYASSSLIARLEGIAVGCIVGRRSYAQPDLLTILALDVSPDYDQSQLREASAVLAHSANASAASDSPRHNRSWRGRSAAQHRLSSGSALARYLTGHEHTGDRRRGELCPRAAALARLPGWHPIGGSLCRETGGWVRFFNCRRGCRIFRPSSTKTPGTHPPGDHGRRGGDRQQRRDLATG